MATKFVQYFNSIRTGYLFHPERIRFPRLSHSKRNIHTPNKFVDSVKRFTMWFTLVVGVMLGSSLIRYVTEESNKRVQSKEKNLKGSFNRHNYNFIADVVDTVADGVVQITVQDKAVIGSNVKGGSGFIIGSDGLVITNAHVVGNKYGKHVNIILRNGKTFLGIVTDIDEVTDLAIVNISGKNLPVLKFASANTVRAGDWVIAIGSPMFLSHTVTAGVVSSVHRRGAEIGLPYQNINYIQTDRGNSGGPLVNLEGEVIGINTMTLTPGISFAIPAEYVMKFVEKYTHKSKSGVIRYYIGLSYLTLSPATRNQILSIVQLPEHLKNGLYVWKVEPDSPAFACGLRSGDVIFECEGYTVYDMKSVMDKVNTKPTVSIKFYRKGVYYTAKLTPKKRFWFEKWILRLDHKRGSC